jgi:hypothetical protein
MQVINRFIIPFILAIVVLSASNLHWSSRFYKGIIGSDGKGYYAYLPAVFIYHDLHFNFADSIEVKYSGRNSYYDYRAEIDHACIDRYFAGTAVAWLPFFLVAHGLSWLLGYPLDGYSFYYQIMVNIAAIFYLFVFMLYLRKLMRLYAVSATNQSIVLVSFVFGTNLFYYTNVEPSMSHVYSLAFITMFLYYARVYLATPNGRQLLFCGLLLGMIMLIRPQNGLIVLALPFMADDRFHFLSALRALLSHKKHLLAAAAATLLICSVQLILYKIETGRFWVDSYPGERFFWTEPEIANILFSYYRGFFVYTPLAFLSLGGLYVVWKQSPFRALSFIAFFGVLTYFLSAWWSWSYGGGFGLRAYVEFYPLFALLLAAALENLRGVFRTGFIVLVFLCVVICQIQTYQYRYDYETWSAMTGKRYWEVFLRIGKRPGGAGI